MTTGRPSPFLPSLSFSFPPPSLHRRHDENHGPCAGALFPPPPSVFTFSGHRSGGVDNKPAFLPSFSSAGMIKKRGVQLVFSPYRRARSFQKKKNWCPTCLSSLLSSFFFSFFSSKRIARLFFPNPFLWKSRRWYW